MRRDPEKELARRVRLLRAWQARLARINHQQERAEGLWALNGWWWKELFLDRLVGWPDPERSWLFEELRVPLVLRQGYAQRHVGLNDYRELGFHMSPDSCRRWRCHEDIVRDMEFVASYWHQWMVVKTDRMPVGSLGWKADGAMVTLTLVGFTPTLVT